VLRSTPPAARRGRPGCSCSQPRTPGHPRIDRYARRCCCCRLLLPLLPLSNDDRVRPDAPALDFAVTKLAPGRLVSHPHLFGVVRKLHACSLPDRESIVMVTRGWAMILANVYDTAQLASVRTAKTRVKSHETRICAPTRPHDSAASATCRSARRIPVGSIRPPVRSVAPILSVHRPPYPPP
jgi:hypothetical protein